MKRRKGVTVFSALNLVFVILAIAAFVVTMLVLAPMFAEQASQAKIVGESYDFLARNKDILAAFTTFDPNYLVPNVTVFTSLGTFVIISVIWLIVGLKRGRKICIFFVCSFLVTTYVELIYYFTFANLQEFLKQYLESNPILYSIVATALLSVLASIFALVLFIVDMATGKVVKEETPTFIKEPTEEIEKGVFEEVKDESEVEEEKEAAAKEEKEETPVLAAEEKEVEAEEKPAAPAKKVKKEPAKKAAPAKKAPAKKAEEKSAKKAAPAKKAEAKPEAKKEDARKTQTILLQNEEGSVYAKAFHVSRRAELNKWQVKATGSDKALKLFNTQKEAIEYANQLAKNQNVSVRVHSKEGKIRKHQ